MKPAQTVIPEFGGPSAVAKLLGIHRSWVSKWQRPRDSGGTGGCIPQKYHRELLDHARQRGIKLTAEDLLPARENAA